MLSWDELTQIWKTRLPTAEIIGISARSNIGIAELESRLLQHLPKGPKYFSSDTVTNRNERFFATEIIREALFSLYQVSIDSTCMMAL